MPNINVRKSEDSQRQGELMTDALGAIDRAGMENVGKFRFDQSKPMVVTIMVSAQVADVLRAELPKLGHKILN